MINDNEIERPDGRSYKQHRPIHVEFNALKGAINSVIVKCGKTEITLALHGPKLTDKRNQFNPKANLICTIYEGNKLNREYGEIMEKTLSQAIILETYPNHTIDITGYIKKKNGSELPLLITSSSILLFKSGIHLYDILTAVNLVKLETNKMIIDPTDKEEKNGNGKILLCMLTSKKEISHIEMIGFWDSKEISKAMSLSIEICQILRKL